MFMVLKKMESVMDPSSCIVSYFNKVIQTPATLYCPLQTKKTFYLVTEMGTEVDRCDGVLLMTRREEEEYVMIM